LIIDQKESLLGGAGWQSFNQRRLYLLAEHELGEPGTWIMIINQKWSLLGGAGWQNFDQRRLHLLAYFELRAN
jgi:hypothetical protein